MSSTSGIESNSLPWVNNPSVPKETALSLGHEIHGIRAPLTSHRQLLEALNDELESMESSEIKKCRLYKIALVIITVIGMAVTFILPISMFFGIPVWIPVVVGLGFGLVTLIIGNKLRNTCNAIRLKYRSLQVYRQQLLSQHPSLTRSTLYKYGIELPKPKKGFKEKIMQQAHLSVDATYDGGATLDKSLDFAGDLPKRYQTNALVGVNSSPTLEMWSKYINAVCAAKSEILKGSPGNEAINTVKQKALLDVGISPDAIIPPGSFIDLAKTIMSACSFGAHVGIEARRAFDQYERSFLHSKTLASWNPSLSGVTKKFFLQGVSTLDFASKTFSKLSSLVANLLSAQWLVDLEALSCLVASSVRGDILEKNAPQIETLCHKLATHEACDSVRLKLILGITHTVSDIVKTPEKKQENIKRLADLHGQLVNECKKIRSRAGGLPEDSLKIVEAKAERSLVKALVGLGDLGKFMDKIRGVVQFGRSASYDLTNAVQKHPERLLASLNGSLNQIECRLHSDIWGAVSNKSFEEVFQEKTEILNAVKQLREKLQLWEQQYIAFKDTKLSRVFLHDFSSSFANFEKYIGEVKNFSEEGAEETAKFLKDCEKSLKATFKELSGGGAATFPKEEELALWSAEYRVLVGQLATCKEYLSTIHKRTQEECVSGSSLLLSALTTQEKTLDKNQRNREAKFKIQAQALRESQRQQQGLQLQRLIQEGIRGLDEIVSGMTEFENSMNNPKDLQTDRIIENSSKLFSAMHTFSSNSFLNLQESLKAQSIKKSGDDTLIVSEETSEVDQGLIASAACAKKSYTNTQKSRHASLNNFLKNLQKTIDKWGMAQSIISGILGLIATALGIAFISTQMVWIVFGICVLSVFMRIIPMVMDHFIEKHLFDVRVVETAKKFIPATKILPSEFGNEDVKRLSELQDVLQLEGFEKTWANEMLKDLDGNPGAKPKKFKDIAKELRSDAKKIDSRMKKLFKKDLLKDQVTTKVTGASEIAETVQNLKEIEKELKLLDTQEDSLIAERLKLCSDQRVFANEKSYLSSLEKQEQEEQDLRENLEKEIRKKVEARNVLFTAIQRIPNKEPVSIDVSEEVRTLNKFCQTIYSKTSSLQEKEKAKKAFKERVLKIASDGNLSRLEAELEMGSCLGSCQARLRDEFELRTRKIRLYEEQEARVKIEAVLESREEILKISGLGHLVPFMRFSSATGGSGRSLAEDAKRKLQQLLDKLQNKDVLGVDECSKALTALAAYLEKHESLESSAYGISSGSALYTSTAGLMRELYAADQILTEGIEMSFGHRCETSLQRVSFVMRELARERNNLSFFKELLQIVSSFYETTPHEEYQQHIQEFLTRIEIIPQEVIIQMCKELEFQINSSVRRVREYQEISQKLVKVSEHVQAKEAAFGDVLRAGVRRLEEISVELGQIKERKSVLQSIKESFSLTDEEVLLDLSNLFGSEDSE
ncbi:hypothetical protein [Chlamydia sp. 17-3921]|uniref:hypothetical protein n=1 Tax=Chlamydia sp. 17-3921 TaxID=2675798 RepID=UPI001919E301|nr:hypothetical protein [Chlamydia sp. 17-3921]